MLQPDHSLFGSKLKSKAISSASRRMFSRRKLAYAEIDFSYRDQISEYEKRGRAREKLANAAVPIAPK